jgi:cell division protease FtsH
MSDKVGNIDYSEAAQGYQGATAGFSVSANTKETVEQEVKKFIQDGYDWALKIIKKKDKEFERLAQGLLEYETLTGEEIGRVMRGEPPQSGPDADDTPDDGAASSVTAIPKTKKAKKKPAAKDGGMEPEPSA